MAQQEPHQLRAGIAGGAEHPDFSFGLLRHWSILGSILHSQEDRIEAMARKNSKVPRSPIRRHGTITRDRTPAPERRGGGERGFGRVSSCARNKAPRAPPVNYEPSSRSTGQNIADAVLLLPKIRWDHAFHDKHEHHRSFG